MLGRLILATMLFYAAFAGYLAVGFIGEMLEQHTSELVLQLKEMEN